MNEFLIDSFLETMKEEWQDGFEIKYRPLLEELLELINNEMLSLSLVEVERTLIVLF